MDLEKIGGGKPDRFFKSGGKAIRVILQQSELAGLVEKIMRLQHGRRLTQAGRDFLDSIDVPEDDLVAKQESWIVQKDLSSSEGEDKNKKVDESKNEGEDNGK